MSPVHCADVEKSWREVRIMQLFDVPQIRRMGRVAGVKGKCAATFRIAAPSFPASSPLEKEPACGQFHTTRNTHESSRSRVGSGAGRAFCLLIEIAPLALLQEMGAKVIR